MLSKSDLENIWNNKPYGYLKTLRKSKKKLYKYVVSVTAYENVMHETKDLEVIATSITEAESLARVEYLANFDKKYSGFKIYTKKVTSKS